MKHRVYLLGICFLLMAFAGSANATTLTTSGYYGYDYGIWTYNGSNEEGYRAMLRAEIDLDENGVADFASSAFCVEKAAEIDIFGATYNATLLTLSGKAFKAAWLMDTYSTTSDGTQMAALQFAIWHVVEDSGFDLTGGTPLSLYNTMLTALNVFDNNGNGDYSYLSDIYRVAQLTDPDLNNIQDLLIKVNPVPEPSTMALFGLGLLGISLVGRKRR